MSEIDRKRAALDAALTESLRRKSAPPDLSAMDGATGYRYAPRTSLPAVAWSLPLVLEDFPARDALPTTDPEEC